MLEDLELSRTLVNVASKSGTTLETLNNKALPREAFAKAGLRLSVFWLGMGLALGVGFAAAFPVNLILVKNGIRHRH